MLWHGELPAAILDIREKFVARKIPVSLGNDRLLSIGRVVVPRLNVIKKLENARFVVKRQRPSEHFARAVHRADSLRRGFRAADVGVQLAFNPARREVHIRGLQRDGNELRVNATNNFAIRENHLTGGTGEHSTALVVDRPVDENPQHDRLVLRATH